MFSSQEEISVPPSGDNSSEVKVFVHRPKRLQGPRWFRSRRQSNKTLQPCRGVCARGRCHCWQSGSVYWLVQVFAIIFKFSYFKQFTELALYIVMHLGVIHILRIHFWGSRWTPLPHIICNYLGKPPSHVICNHLDLPPKITKITRKLRQMGKKQNFGMVTYIIYYIAYLAHQPVYI